DKIIGGLGRDTLAGGSGDDTLLAGRIASGDGPADEGNLLYGDEYRAVTPLGAPRSVLLAHVPQPGEIMRLALASGAVMALKDDGRIVYDPRGSTQGTDTFFYVVRDLHTGAETRTDVTVTLGAPGAPGTSVDDLIVTPRDRAATLLPSALGHGED